MLPPPPTSTLFPYTTLFRSEALGLQSTTKGRAVLYTVTNVPANTVDILGNAAVNNSRMLATATGPRSEEHTSELQSHVNLVCRLLLEKKKYMQIMSQS